MWRAAACCSQDRVRDGGRTPTSAFGKRVRP
eukprot:CAMPEP_0175283934 /NCGR_PEP_ID=MMETSP0093-20121207/52410_1 /TAXON_ID=311494 /ORGANISM="Alexandrium monilatum, Strain CCMP3105" /LENGTH=30 /DNA_ID= /DNA_START= /DNA_END= /DNA_ORIENTATION=